VSADTLQTLQVQLVDHGKCQSGHGGSESGGTGLPHLQYGMSLEASRILKFAFRIVVEEV
jgi:hypothetical protein